MVEKRPVFRVGTIKCRVDKPFVYNHDFTVTKGKEWFVDGELRFTPGTSIKPDGFYRTLFGPCVSHDAVTYCKCDHCVRFAFRRLTCVRRPEDPSFETTMRRNQHHFIVAHEFLPTLIQPIIRPFFESYLGTESEALEHHADPHPKRALRIAAWNELNDSGGRFRRTFMERDGKPTAVNYKMKREEHAKPGKYPRMIGDLGCPASLAGAWVADRVKQALASEPIRINGGFIEFCKTPSPAKLAQVFKNLIDPPGRFYFVYFSDDSCLSIRDAAGKVHRYNVDISTCDASHTSALFDLLTRIVPETVADDMTRLVEQCKAPIKLVSSSNLSERVTLKPRGPKLYSGSTLTTIINNLANILIAIAISETSFTGSDSVVAAAAKCGYVVTCEECGVWQDLQFLKHSPVLDTTGEIRPMLNLGVLLRLSGSCAGDLPGRGAIKDRALRFQAGLLAGAYPYTQFDLLTALKSSCDVTVDSRTKAAVQHLLRYKVSAAGYPTYTVDDQQLYRRYRLSNLEALELKETFGLGGYESHSNTSGIQKILHKDYQLNVKGSYEQSATEQIYS